MREMKNSGVAWIGTIPQDWQLSKIGSLYTQRNEKVSDKDYQPLSVTMQGILPQLATAAKTDDGDNRKLVRVGDFAINSRSDRRGSCGISPLDGSVSLINIILTPRTAMHPGYYNWLFHTTLFADEFYKWGHGIVADLWTTRWQEMKSITVPVPEYAEQERIAAFLDAECAEIDAVLEKTRASIEEYKKLKQAVITQAVTKGIFDKQIYSHNVKLKYLLYIASGDAIRNEELSEVGKYPAYGGGESLGFASKYNTLENSLIVGRVGARCGCVTYIDSKAWATDNALIVHPICNPRYMYYMLIYSQLNNLNTSNAQPLITATKIKNVVVPYFLEDICQKKIVDFLDEKCACIDAIIEKKQQYLTEIENYKKSLIYEYVTGKKEVKTSVLAD